MLGRLSILAAPLIAIVLISVALYGISLLMDAVRFLVWLVRQK